MTQCEVSPRFYSSEPSLEAKQMSRNFSSLRHSNLFSSPNAVAIERQQSVGSLAGTKSGLCPLNITLKYYLSITWSTAPFGDSRRSGGGKFPAEIFLQALDTPPHLGNTLGTCSSCSTTSTGTQPWWQGSHHIPQQFFPVLNSPHG